MIKFEYKRIDVALSEAEDKLNALGSEAWELVSTIDVSPSFVRFILKRQISSMEIKMIGVE